MISLISSDTVLQRLRRAYLDLDHLVESFDAPKREQNRIELENFRRLLGKNLGEFSPSLISTLVCLGCNLARIAGNSSNDERTKIVERGEWWLSFASACGAPSAVWAIPLELWAYGHTITIARPNDPDQLLSDLKQEMGNLDLSSIPVELHFKIGIIGAFATLLSQGDALNEQTPKLLRQWCEDIFLSGHTSELLDLSATQLGVQRTLTSQVCDPATLASTLTIWKTPPEATRVALETELEDLLVELRCLLRLDSGILTQRTAEQVRLLKPEFELPDLHTALSFAGQNLWHAFVSKGDSSALTLSRRLFLFLIQRAALYKIEERQRAMAFYWWMNSQLPGLIYTCALTEILKEGLIFYDVLSIAKGDLSLREGLIEAAVGECRRLEGTGQKDEQKMFLQEHATALKQIHSEYVRRAGKKQSSLEEAAWNYLKPHT